VLETQFDMVENLTKMRFSYRNRFSGVTDLSMEKLGHTLKGLGHLETLYLYFSE